MQLDSSGAAKDYDYLVFGNLFSVSTHALKPQVHIHIQMTTHLPPQKGKTNKFPLSGRFCSPVPIIAGSSLAVAPSLSNVRYSIWILPCPATLCLFCLHPQSLPYLTLQALSTCQIPYKFQIAVKIKNIRM